MSSRVLRPRKTAASFAAVHASELSSEALRKLGESTGVELMGDWTEADIEGFDDALNAEDSHAAAQAIARLAAVGIDANGTPVAKGDAVVEEEELFDLD